VARRPQGQAEPEDTPSRPQAPTQVPAEAQEGRPQSPAFTADGQSADQAARFEGAATHEQAATEPAGGGRKARKRARKGPFSFLKELPALIIIAFVLALLIKSFLIQAFFIPSESMEPTLKPGDRVLVNKVVYHLHPPRRGDVIVFQNPNPGEEPDRGVIGGFFHWITEGLGISAPEDEDFIKRVIGLPGDTVEERPNGDIYVNGHKLDEPYLKGQRDLRPQGLPVWHVPPGELFVLGDNRANSNDSRFGLGYIPIDRVVGRAFIIIWPPSRFGGPAGGTHFAPR
jgi:signal peptidase I